MTGATSITRDDYFAGLREVYPFEEAQNEGGHVILVSTTDIATLNPVTRSDIIARYAINTIFSYLALQSPIDGTMAPDLADYWVLAADGTTYTFHLNPNATWHDGEPVTAEDAVLTFDAVMAEDSANPLGSELTSTAASYRAVDDHTFEVIPRSLPQPTMMEQVIAGDYQLATLSIVWTLDDLGVLYRCDAMPPAGFNLARNCNEEYDRLNTESAGEMDAGKRRELIIEQGNIANDEAHYGLLYFSQSVVPVNNRVKNMFVSAFGEMWSMSDVWVAAE